jgi:hypothetical protein
VSSILNMPSPPPPSSCFIPQPQRFPGAKLTV